MTASPTIHASAVLAGARGILIRGPAGAGKSRLVLSLLHAAAGGQIAFARLVADDRVHVEAVHDRLIARPPAALAGLLEVRGLGIQQWPYEPVAVIAWVVDLGVGSPPRLPGAAELRTEVAGVAVRRLAVPPGCDPVPLVLAAIAGRPLIGDPVTAGAGAAIVEHPGIKGSSVIWPTYLPHVAW